MNFDNIIIGGGLAGLVCGIRLQQQGQHCAIITTGQSAIDFSSGSLDLLSYLPNQQGKTTLVTQFAQGIKQTESTHPYHLIGVENCLHYAKEFCQLVENLDLPLQGSAESNHYRITPLGTLYATWLSPRSVPTLTLEQAQFPYRSVMLLGIEGYHDFQPQLAAENLKALPQFAQCDIQFNYLSIPELDYLRSNAREFRSVNISQTLEHKLNFAALVKEINGAANNAEAVFLPACFGLDNDEFFNQLQQATRPILFELPTLPPSLLGLRQHYILRREFERLGGILMQGDSVIKSEFCDQRVSKIFTVRHEDMPLTAENYILATGSFFSNGLQAEFERIIEPIFNLDLFSALPRTDWTTKRFSDAQPYQSYGVKINSFCQAQKGGMTLNNLYAIGNVVGGFNALHQGCGSGVSILTALHTATHIMQQKKEGEL